MAIQAAPLSSISVTPANPTINADQTQQFTATGAFNDGTMRVLNGNRVVAAAAGISHTCALLLNGAVQCRGRNMYGQLGNSTFTDSHTPTTISGISNAIAISAGVNHTCAALASGTVQCWGSNFSGQLGNGTNTNSLTPVTVTGIVNSTAIAGGGNSTCAKLA